MGESVSAACIKSYDKAEKGTLSPLECLSFANTIQADLPTCGYNTRQHIFFLTRA